MYWEGKIFMYINICRREIFIFQLYQSMFLHKQLTVYKVDNTITVADYAHKYRVEVSYNWVFLNLGNTEMPWWFYDYYLPFKSYRKYFWI